MTLSEIARRGLTRLTHRLHSMPILVLMPHSRCNCRCVMCDIWKANKAGDEITMEQLAPHIESLRRLNVQQVVLSGGEALMHKNLWTLCEALRPLDVKITLLSTGLLLERHAEAVVRWCDEVIVSLDGSPSVHDGIRRVPRAFERLSLGLQAIRRQDPDMRITGRCVIQRENHADFLNIVDAAIDLGLDQISFLGADVSSEAFNRPDGWGDERVSDVALSTGEIHELRQLIDDVTSQRADLFARNFIAESPDKLRRIADYYDAINGAREFPPVQCNAPWTSAVVEADGTIRPCFFQPAYGHLDDAPLHKTLNSRESVRFRQTLDVAQNPICQRCVCSLNLGLRADVRS